MTTPIERHGPYWAKRDDLYRAPGGAAGGKARTAWALAQGARGLTTAGSRSSPQVEIVGRIAQHLGLPFRAHTPSGPPGPEVQDALDHGAERIQHRAGYQSVIAARAREDAQARGWRYIPFGMECEEALQLTAAEVCDIPAVVRRIVVPVGSGMSLAGILWGMLERRIDLPVLGVVCGGDATRRLARWAPPGWPLRCELVPSGVAYEQEQHWVLPSGLGLDPIYEAKCVPFLQPMDLLWVVGARARVAG